jgi:DNA polymerase I-like protein with 3'-5' exonuclease and polymerase domains
MLLYPELLSMPTWKLVDAVHDSVLLEVPAADAAEAAQVLQRCMIEGMERLVRTVPIKVDIKMGESWELAEK